MSPSRPFRDTLSRFVFERAAVRGALVSLDACCHDILACHPYPAPLRRVLAELLAASALLASALKFKGSLIVQLRGEGPVRLLVVECDAALTLRATAQWDRRRGGPRRRHGSRDPRRRQRPRAPRDHARPQGRRAALSGHRRPGSRVDRDADRALPHDVGADREPPGAGDAGRARARPAAAAPAGRGTRGRDDLAPRGCARPPPSSPRRRSSAQAAPRTSSVPGFPSTTSGCSTARPPRFACGCSRERIGNALRLLGRAEVENILAEQGMIGVTCEFCNRRYTLVAADARALFADRTRRSPERAGRAIRRDAALTRRVISAPGAAHEPLRPSALHGRRARRDRPDRPRSPVRDARHAGAAGAVRHASSAAAHRRLRAARHADRPFRARQSALAGSRGPANRSRSFTVRTRTYRRRGTPSPRRPCRRGTTRSCTRTAGSSSRNAPPKRRRSSTS